MINENIHVYLVNLERDHERRERTTGQLSQLGITPIVVTACDGHAKNFSFSKYRKYSRGKWWDSSVFKPGAFACYLSHIKCWERIAQNSAPYGVVLEDDIIINLESFSKFTVDRNVESEFDIIFINHGVCRLFSMLSERDRHLNDSFMRLNWLFVQLVLKNKFHNNLSPGSYGYICSKKGAKNLLRITNKEGIYMGVDFAMLFNSLENADLNDISKLNNLPKYVRIYLESIKDNADSGENRITLNSFLCIPTPLVSHIDTEESRIKHDVLHSFEIFDKKMTILHKIMHLICKSFPFLK